MKTIWKFPLEVTAVQYVGMPRGSEILSVDSQRDTVCLWAMVDPDAAKEVRTIRIFGTGHPVGDEEKLVYLGMAKILHESLIFHVFERRP